MRKPTGKKGDPERTIGPDPYLYFVCFGYFLVDRHGLGTCDSSCFSCGVSCAEIRSVPVGAQAKRMMGQREEYQLQNRKGHRRLMSKAEWKKEKLHSEYPLETGGVLGLGAAASIVLVSCAYWVVNISDPQKHPSM